MKKIKLLILMLLMCFVTTGCIKEDIAKYKITNRAKEYFASKYNIKKSKIKVTANHFYPKDQRCWWSCGENYANIEYKGTSYKIEYDEIKDSFGDDYQYGEIYNDLYTYLKEKFPYATTLKIDYLDADVLATSEKYTGDIKDYLTNKVEFPEYRSATSTWIKVWVEAQDEEQAKALHSQYQKELVTELESLGVSYRVAFSKEEDDNEYSAFYYYSVVNEGRTLAFMFYDRVDKTNSKHCAQKRISFVDDKLICG